MFLNTVSDTMSITVDPAFKMIPKNQTAFFIWRIENMQVTAIPRDQYGKFFTGDSYIVYAATEYGQPCSIDVKNKEVRGKIEVHVHFWLGLETSQDEAGVAAYKTVELDDFLGGGPVQHREVEGKESPRFRAYFKNGLTVLKGGAASGFHHVTDTFEPKLFRVKGKRSPLVTQQSSIGWEHFNSGDVFLLDTKQVIFVWVGRTANNMEKIMSAKVAQQLKAEYGDSSVVYVDDGKEMGLPETERRYFEKFLPLKIRVVKSAEEAGEDEEVEQNSLSELRLYHCNDDDGTLKVTEVKTGPLLQSDLSSDDSFIVDNGSAGIWVWVGRRASNKERVEAMRNAHGFVKKKGYPIHTAVTRVIDGGEPVEFKMLFQSWKEPNQSLGIGRQNSSTRVAHTVQTKFDATTLHEQPRLAAASQMVDDGSGEAEVWRVENFDLVPVTHDKKGLFFSGDCYVIKYSYYAGTAQKFIIYFWLGQHSSQDEQGTAALKAVEKDDEEGGAAVQVRVVQEKEPAHFMAIFGGQLVIFKGGKSSSFDGDGAKDVGIPDTYLLQVRGNSKQSTKATQVDLRAASLNSNDVFVLVTGGTTYIWCGKGSTGDEREMAKHLASRSGEGVVVYEGQEKPEFWEAIGGKEEYANDKRLADSNEQLPARLFQCSNATGTFKAEELVNFTQQDLVPEDVMLLDARDSIFLWVGKDSRKDEQKLAEEMAFSYLKSDPSGRDADTPILRIKQGYEPPNFTGFFGVWDTGLWNDYKSFIELRQELEGSNPVLQIKADEMNGNYAFQDYSKYPVEALTEKDPEKLPTDVDPLHKEMYLTEDDFTSVFGMDYSKFESLPAWKQQQLKKNKGLF